jgi:Rhodopirellula transposase DDE domain
MAMVEQREEQYVQLIQSAARRLSGHERRAFIAEVTQTLCVDNPRQSERMFGWGRETAALGIHERDSGIRCQESFCQRGRKRTEDKQPELEKHIRELVEPHAQADPKLKNTFAYTRVTAKALREALIAERGYRSEDLPCERTLQQILNRLGYRLRRIQKTKPLKKIDETDAILANVRKVHEEVVNDPETLELSLDTKAKVPFGDYSREGETRSDSTGKVPGAWDKDPPAKKKGCPLES